MIIRVRVLLLLFASLCSAGSGAAEAEPGLVTFTKGNSQIFTSSKPNEGTVLQVQYEGKRYFARPTKRGDKVFAGDVVNTGPGARARIVYSDGDQLNVGPGSSIEIAKRESKAAKSSTILNVLHGRVRAVVPKKNAKADTGFTVRTRSAVAGVRGTDFTVEYVPSTGLSEVSVLRGAVGLRPIDEKAAKKEAVEVKSGFSGVVRDEPAAKTQGAATPPDSRAVELKRTSKEILADIHKFSHVIVETTPQAAGAVPPAVEEEIKKAEQTAATSVLEDIKSTDPGLHARLTGANEPITAAHLNAAVVSQQMEAAPADKPTEKRLKDELRDTDEDVYKKYFKTD